MKRLALLVGSLFAMPLSVFAHEVYVLKPGEIDLAISSVSPNPFSAIPLNGLQFIGWGIACAILVLIVLAFSVSPLFEEVFDRFLMPLKKYAPLAGRLTLGFSLICSGYFHALFGPELSLQSIVGSMDGALSTVLIVVGVAVVLGIFTRVAAVIAFCVFLLSIVQDNLYMLTYANYLGEILLVFILGGGIFSFDRLVWRNMKPGRIALFWEEYSFLILRVLYGSAIIFASFYAKFLHSNLAMTTISSYHLTHYFPFSPLFLVLGAFIVEFMLGLCFIVGFEIRFATIVFTIFLTQSILFFGEAVWPHLILFGVNIALFCHGYDKYTLTHFLFQRKRTGEPVL